MNPAEFANIARAEQDLWWYRGMRRILFRMLDPLAAGSGFRRALEAGCGTGHFAQALASRYGMRVFPIDLGWQGLRHAQRLGHGDLHDHAQPRAMSERFLTASPTRTPRAQRLPAAWRGIARHEDAVRPQA